MSTINNLHRVIFLKGVMNDTMQREEQLRYLNELLYERAPQSKIAQELQTHIQKIRFLQDLKNGNRKVEDIMPILAETWYHKEGKYQLLGTGKWMTRAEYRDLPEPEGQLLVRMIYYL